MVLAGTALSFSSNVLSAFLPQFNLIIASRAVAGIGKCLAFPSLLVALPRSFRRGSEALSVGLMNGAFNLGGILGLFGWAVFGTIVGWRTSVLIAGLLGLASSIPLFFVLPNDSLKADFKVRIEQLTSVIIRREVVTIVLSLFGIAWGASISWGFLVYYLKGTLNIGPGLAGLTWSLSLIFSLLVSPIIGQRYDKFGDARKWVLVAGVITAIGIACASIHSLFFAIISSSTVGIGFGVGFTVGLSAAWDLCSKNIEYESMAVSWVDGLSLFGSFFAPLDFCFYRGIIRVSRWLVPCCSVRNLADIAYKNYEETERDSGWSIALEKKTGFTLSPTYMVLIDVFTSSSMRAISTMRMS